MSRIAPGLVSVTILLMAVAQCRAEESSATGSWQIAAERQARAAMSQRVTCNFHDEELHRVVSWFAVHCQIKFAIDTKALEEAGVATDTPVTFQMPDINARSALEHILMPMDLTWIMRTDMILITTEAQAETVLDTRVYPVRDLVETSGGPDFDSLIEIITAVAAPTTWNEVGGSGAIKAFYGGRSLVISQTREVHEEVEQLLASLRAVRNLQGISAGQAIPSAESPWQPTPEVHATIGAGVAYRVGTTSQPGWRMPRAYE